LCAFSRVAAGQLHCSDMLLECRINPCLEDELDVEIVLALFMLLLSSASSALLRNANLLARNRNDDISAIRILRVSNWK